MTVKPTFSRLSTLVNGVSNMNAIITQIETAFQNTLSRDGSTPNQMTSTLDMNSNQIINCGPLDMNNNPITGLPAPSTGDSPIRWSDIALMGDDTPTSDHVTKRQFFAAVATLGDMNLLYQAVSADANNAIWIEFWAARTTAKSGALALLAQTTFGWTDSQLTACFTLAATLTP